MSECVVTAPVEHVGELVELVKPGSSFGVIRVILGAKGERPVGRRSTCGQHVGSAIEGVTLIVVGIIEVIPVELAGGAVFPAENPQRAELQAADGMGLQGRPLIGDGNYPPADLVQPRGIHQLIACLGGDPFVLIFQIGLTQRIDGRTGAHEGLVDSRWIVGLCAQCVGGVKTDADLEAREEGGGVTILMRPARE